MSLTFYYFSPEKFAITMLFENYEDVLQLLWSRDSNPISVLTLNGMHSKISLELTRTSFILIHQDILFP